MKLLNAATAAAASPPEALADAYDVAIVGAGLTGLRLAQRLEGADARVIVLEAADRPGGRVYTRALRPGCPVDLGAEFVGPTQNRVLALARTLGVTLEPVSTNGDNLFESSAGLARYPATNAIPPVDAESLAQLTTCAVELDSNARQPSDPASGPDTSVADWIRRHQTSAVCAELLTFVCRSIASAEPDSVSMRHLLAQVRAAGDDDNVGSVFRIISTTDGAQKYRIAEGAGELVARLLTTITGPVLGDSAVSAITSSAGAYRLSGHEFHVTSAAVVVAMSPPLAARIAYSPAPPPDISAHHRAYQLGRSIKFAAAYDHEFWSEAGLSGHLNSTIGPVQSVYSRSYGQHGGALIGFIKADDAWSLAQAGNAAIRRAVDDHLTRAFGVAAQHHHHLTFHAWDEKSWSGGCPCGYQPVGHTDPLIADEIVGYDGMYWSATESARHWRGYMDGALGAADALFDVLAHQRATLR